MLDAEATHRAHAIVEQEIAHLEAGSLAHPPPGSLVTDSAWLVPIAFDPTRAAGTLASAVHARATSEPPPSTARRPCGG